MRRKRDGRHVRLSMPPTLFSHWLIGACLTSTPSTGTVLSFAPYRRDDPLTSPLTRRLDPHRQPALSPDLAGRLSGGA